MKPFDLGLAKMGHPVQTRNGRPARIICWDMKDICRNIVALVSNGIGAEEATYYDNTGKFLHEFVDDEYDLFMADYVDPGLHVDDFIDFGTAFTGPSLKGEHEARWFLFLHRLPANLRMEFKDKIDHLTLFCDYQDVRHRVTGASSMGDVWLTTDFNKDTGYDKRVDVLECSNWGEEA